MCWRESLTVELGNTWLFLEVCNFISIRFYTMHPTMKSYPNMYLDLNTKDRMNLWFKSLPIILNIFELIYSHYTCIYKKLTLFLKNYKNSNWDHGTKNIMKFEVICLWGYRKIHPKNITKASNLVYIPHIYCGHHSAISTVKKFFLSNIIVILSA